MAERVVANVGDIHCGSIYALLPPDFIDGSERIVPQNFGQAYLWECWDAFGDWFTDDNVTDVVINGDAVDGIGRKSAGGETCLIRPADQCRAAKVCIEHLLSKLKTKPAVWFTAGTDYHVGEMGREEEAIAAALHAEVYRGEGVGYQIKEVLNLSTDGVVGNFAHHMAFAPVNQSRPLEQEIWGAKLAIAAGEHDPIDYIVRNHVHYGKVVDDGDIQAAACGCWQLRTKFGRRGGVFKFRPKIGGLKIRIDGADKARGQKAVWIEQRNFQLPKPAVVVHGA